MAFILELLIISTKILISFEVTFSSCNSMLEPSISTTHFVARVEVDTCLRMMARLFAMLIWLTSLSYMEQKINQKQDWEWEWRGCGVDWGVGFRHWSSLLPSR